MTRPDIRSAAMKELVSLLEGFDERDPGDPVLFRELLPQVLEEALPELSDRLVRPSTSRALKRLILGSPARTPHAGWTPVLQRSLMHEPDPDLFEEGCRALAQTGGEAETDALRQVARQRPEEPFHAIVARKLAFLEPRQPFAFHLRDLLLGSQNPRLSGRAAEHLTGSVRLEHLGDLASASEHPDAMASQHALRVIASLRRVEAARFLLQRFEVASDALRLDNWLRSAQEQIKRAPAQEVKSVLLALLRSCPEAGPHEALLVEIGQALEDPAADALTLVQRLMAGLTGLKESRLAACLADLALGRSVRLANLMPEPPEEIRLRMQRLQGTVDACAEGLARFVRQGVLPKEELMPSFLKAYESGAGGDGFGRSFAEVLDPGDEAWRELILAATNHHWREEGIEVLGELERPELLPFFLKAMGDPIVDIAQQAIRCLGRLPGAFGAALELFQSGRADQMERAVEIFALNGMAGAAPVLLEFLQRGEREDTLIAAIRCLGTLKAREAVEPLLSLLRNGQSSRLQRALAESLMEMDALEAARGLLRKAVEVRNPSVQLLALEAINRHRSDLRHGLEPDECRWAEALLEACFEEGAPYNCRAILAAQHFWCLDRPWLERIETRLGAVIAEQRKRQTWDKDQQVAVATAMRELERKRRELELLASKGHPAQELLMACAEAGEPQADLLQALLSALEAPGLLLGPELRAGLEALVESELARPGLEAPVLEALCRLAGEVRDQGAIGPIRSLLERSGPRSNLHQACREALARLGAEAPGPAGGPVGGSAEILLLEPSAFFRRRLVAALPERSVREAQDRDEAASLLAEAPADVLVSEGADGTGDLQDWFEAQWRAGRLRQVILSTSSRSQPALADKPWIRAVLFKPYAMEELLELL